ncbi:MAG: ArdC family protein [bacterium]|nr:ArdC family protein [bacterium]
MKYYGKSQEVCKKVIAFFKSGNLPEVIAPIFVHRSDDIPCRAWSFSNQFVTAINGTSDARGFKQWQTAGRKVKKGSRAFHILGPCISKKTETGPDGTKAEKAFLFGFKSIPVFRIEDTEILNTEKWESVSKVDVAEENRLMSLPLRDVADAWGLDVTSFNARKTGYKGYYSAGKNVIALGVENLATWTHELMHAADDRNGTLTRAPGQQPDNEIVAELGGAVILEMMGYKTESDTGGAWEYVKHYAGKDHDKAVRECFALLNRICACIDLIVAESVNSERRKAA